MNRIRSPNSGPAALAETSSPLWLISAGMLIRSLACADAASRQILQDLGRWGVHADFLELTEAGSTPVIVQHIHCSPGLGKTHSFSRRCPFCGAMLPWYKPLRIVDTARIVLQLPQAATFFFDRVSPGAIRLARHAAESGSLVVFEPSASSDSHRLGEALGVAHIVKYSIDRLESLGDFRRGEGPRLVIETRGGEGLRFLSRPDRQGGEWQVSESFAAPQVIDTSGCGDWCTAGIIHMLGRDGVEGLLEATPGRIDQAIWFGQALASWNCGFRRGAGRDVPVRQRAHDRLCEKPALGRAIATGSGRNRPSRVRSRRRIRLCSVWRSVRSPVRADWWQIGGTRGASRLSDRQFVGLRDPRFASQLPPDG